ncbi:MAG: hypothetical protein CL933_03135 [Deltaproteobacteria bacterium]|nr:hypothetical protein [Deltaproteobacteria bacterium]
MAGSAFSRPREAEISERFHELVLPDEGRDETRGPQRAREIGMSESRDMTRPATPSSMAESDGHGPIDDAAKQASPHADAARVRGIALPGDRSTQSDRSARDRERQAQRPSFWRRIALGRRVIGAARGKATPTEELTRASEPAHKAQVPVRRRADPSPPKPFDTRGAETRIVESLLQALVSVEAKLERSHTELLGRSDQVEQRLTQLWDIEEQLGTLGELQESLLRVSEQQRRLEFAVVSQTRTLKWLVASVFFSLAAAAFVVAAILQ